jgi:hypothetical protein
MGAGIPCMDVLKDEAKKVAADKAVGGFPEGTLELLEAVNKEYAACMLSGKFRVLAEQVSYQISSKGTNAVEFIDKGSWLSYMENRTCKVFAGANGATKKTSLANLWMKWEGRRSYRSVVFDPSEEIPKDAFNFFRGLPIKPIKGSWDKFKSHMFNVLCDKNILYFDYLMSWMARCVQDPGGKRPGVAVVLVGGKGTGKGTFAREFGKLFGENFTHVASSKGLVGDFNIHLARSIVCFADEAIWGADHKNEGALKALVTEPLILFTPKGIDSINMKSHLNIIMAANTRNVVPASPDERRFFVLECKTRDYVDTHYFEEIYKELRAGGTEAMMYELLNHDYSGIDLTKAPKTEALAGQVEANLTNTLEFWQDVLERGFLLSGKDDGSPLITSNKNGALASRSEWPEAVWKYEVAFEYTTIFGRGKAYLDPVNTFWKETRGFYKMEMKMRSDAGVRQREILIPELDVLRSAFTELTGIEFKDEQEGQREVREPF